MDQFVTGAIATTFGVAGLFFLRFWRDTGDRLFGLFAVALFALAASRVRLAVAAHNGWDGGHLYWVRLLAFALILAANLDKNRPRGPAPWRGPTDGGLAGRRTEQEPSARSPA